ncbi:ubiquitin-conjugating enzyme E2 [Bacillus sp. T3]|uniref:ubiquitin-conjugating enzyme E2 n=1 Tax=Bacillus sp. T3 TaxID=467262 RepID=UPI002982079F|nr:ubiquitin-conjugating enzyme E2 [Bacillus sp. T3]
MTARMRRLSSDYEEIKKEFAGHSYVKVAPNNNELPDKYNITYFVNGIYLLPDGKIEILGRHEVEITLHAEYPRFKPICKISTPIWHPNFKDGQICIGDIWGAGESLSDIIINIGDMIQYKSWNSYSPLSADAAQWAMENKHIFPVGTLELRRVDYSATISEVEINLFDEKGQVISESVDEELSKTNEELATTITAVFDEEKPIGNDFDIIADDLVGIEFVPTVQRMQSLQHGGVVKGRKINFKTILMKGLLWGLIGGVIGWLLQELIKINTDTVLGWMGHGSLKDLYAKILEGSLIEDKGIEIIKNAVRIESAFFAAFIAVGLGALLGLGEGLYYGSKEKAFKYFGIGAGISIVIGFVSGYIAQYIYSTLLFDSSTEIGAAFIRGLGWGVMGLGVGFAIGLIKPEKKRILFCSLGGLAGGFVGGFIFNFIFQSTNTGENDSGMIPRAIGIIIMGLLIGLGIGLLEQFAKAAWLKVVRGEFEGKEYLVFTWNNKHRK